MFIFGRFEVDGSLKDTKSEKPGEFLRQSNSFAGVNFLWVQLFCGLEEVYIQNILV